MTVVTVSAGRWLNSRRRWLAKGCKPLEPNSQSVIFLLYTNARHVINKRRTSLGGWCQELSSNTKLNEIRQRRVRWHQFQKWSVWLVCTIHSPCNPFQPQNGKQTIHFQSIAEQELHLAIFFAGVGSRVEFRKMKKVNLLCISHWSETDENAIDCEIACDCVKRANVVLGQCIEIFARKLTATHNCKPTSAQPLINENDDTQTYTHLITACGAPRSTA